MEDLLQLLQPPLRPASPRPSCIAAGISRVPRAALDAFETPGVEVEMKKQAPGPGSFWDGLQFSTGASLPSDPEHPPRPVQSHSPGQLQDLLLSHSRPKSTGRPTSYPSAAPPCTSPLELPSSAQPHLLLFSKPPPAEDTAPALRDPGSRPSSQPPAIYRAPGFLRFPTLELPTSASLPNAPQQTPRSVQSLPPGQLQAPLIRVGMRTAHCAGTRSSARVCPRLRSLV